ncbi:glycosyltransferase family 2 protein [Agriterribacter sp.]|uniref:glycosyltransferase family 2 protein n=1 Tax=Agriterribacter sp. TaxID=2821509 RepID=UPI002BC1F018|nr:glycosyltransferase [Agriterribacter sp.]HTN05951.1 glycosyltransferase [Agriterribacter sp.]
MNSIAFQSFKRTEKNDSLFSILIPSWNNLPYLKLCIDSIQKNSTYSHQIIVHINEGTDGSLAWIEQQTHLDYTYSKENIGVCYALNACSQLSSTDYILYMNDDMYACPGWDAALWQEIEAIGHPYFFLSATAIEPGPQSNCSISKNYGTVINDFNEQQLLREYAHLPMPDWMGATWSPNIVHRSIWNMAGGYSIEFSPGMYSDPDFSMKLWQMGIRLFKGLAASRVYHFGSVSVKRVKKNKGYYQFIGKWGMTSSTFSKEFIRRGEAFDGTCKAVDLPALLRFKNLVKRITTAFVPVHNK